MQNILLFSCLPHTKAYTLIDQIDLALHDQQSHMHCPIFAPSPLFD